MLWLWAVPWPDLHLSSQLERVLINDILSIGSWGDCSHLEHMYVKRGLSLPNFSTIPPDWLTNCTQLKSLDLRNMSITEIRAVLDSAPAVEELTLYNVRDMPYIVHYPLISTKRNSHEFLQKVSIVTYYDKNLNGDNTWKDVSATLAWQLSLLPSLKNLKIIDKSFDFCTSSKFIPVIFASLQSLTLQNTNTKRLCLKKHHVAPLLSKIDLWASPGFKIQFSELYSEAAPHLVVNLHSFGQVLSFIFTRDDYMALSDVSKGGKKGNVTILGFQQSIECDCSSRASWFSRALRAKLVSAPGVSCFNELSPADLECEWLDCERIPCKGACVCCRENHHAIRVDCRDADLDSLSAELLQLPNLTHIIAPKNNIRALPFHLPDTLKWLDLSGNNIWQNGSRNVHSLFAQPTRRVRLARNYIVCSCDNLDLLTVLQSHSHQIDDFDNVTCAVTNIKIGDIDITRLCLSKEQDEALLKQRQIMIVTVVVVLVMTAIILVILTVMYYHRRDIQVFLFARGWCLFCVREEELDADRHYDIFISFCHEDSDFMLKNLLPPLDRDYSVCLHLRDWCPGVMIPMQITMSVRQSRRTVVVLSRNFVRSLWGRLEFQTAHVSSVIEGRVRVVMIVLDDVLEKEDLPPELRSYVNLNTYVRWDDPWFWDKLRYALPHRPSPFIPQARGTSEVR